MNFNLGEFNWDLLANFEDELLETVGLGDEIDKFMGKSEDSKSLGYTIDCPHCSKKIKVSNRVKTVEKAIDN